MGGTKNINNKLLIGIFTALFLIGSIYSVYSQATSTQNNAVSSLESNSIIQEIVSSASSGYSTAGQYLASFLSINGIPSYVWTIITFLITTLFFIAVYAFLFEIFIQRARIKESETMKKAKILFIFALSVFSAIAIGYAIPFLLNLYGLILLILVIIALFFFGRAAISYGKSFHYATKSFEADVKKDLLKAMKELEELENKKDLSKVDVMDLSELLNVLKKNLNLFDEYQKARATADNGFDTILRYIKSDHSAFFNNLIDKYEKYLNSDNIKKTLNQEQKNKLENFLKELTNKRNIDIDDIQRLRKIRSIKELYDDILGQINELDKDPNIDKSVISEFRKMLNEEYQAASGYKQEILNYIDTALKEYRRARELLFQMFYEYETKFKKNINSRLRSILRARVKSDELEKIIKRDLNLVDERIKLLEELHTHY
jgi:hypothetical protein